MSVLRNLESKIAGLVEGAFGRAFKSEVRPVEIARKLAREMEEHKSVSVSRTYVPNEYVVFLSPEDRERLADFEAELGDELAGYLLEHARRERLAVIAKPVVEFRTDDRLELGEFGIDARVVRGGTEAPAAAPSRAARGAPASPPSAPPAPSPPPAGASESSHTIVYSSAERLRRPLEEQAQARHATALVVVAGKRMVVGSSGAVLGRSRECDIVVEDPNVSRRHAAIRPSGGSWTIEDLGSTNGVLVNGVRAGRPVVLAPGDRIELGTAPLTFELD